MIEVLKYINSELQKIKVPYEFGEWTSKVVYPYFVGEYTEVTPLNEDGQEEKTFILNGFTRKSALEFEKIKAKIQKHFPAVGGRTAVLDDCSGIAVFYSNSNYIPTNVEGLKRIQINLTVKIWKVR